MKAVMALLAGYTRAMGILLKCLWQAFSGRVSLLFSLVVLAGFSLFYLLGTESGRVTLTRGAIYAAQQWHPQLHIDAGAISSGHLGQWSFSRLKIDHNSDTLAQARALALDIDLGGLLRGRIDIAALDAAELTFDIDLLNILLAAHPQEENTEPSRTPLSVPAVRLDALNVDRLQLIDSRMPELPVVSVSASGRYRWLREPARLSLEVREHKGGGLRLSLTGRETQPGRYRLVFSASEGAGGFAGKQLQLPEGQPLDVDGSVFLRQLDGRLLADIETFSLPLVNHHFALSGDVEILFSPWQISAQALLLEVDDSRHRIAGSISADKVDAEIKFQRLPVAISQPWQHYLVGGSLSADLSVRGSMPLPSISGILDLDSHFRARAEDQPQPLHLQAKVQTRDKIIHLDTATLDYAEATIGAAGQVDLGGETLDLQGTIQRLTLDELRALLAVLPGTDGVAIPENLDGALERLQIAAKGPWKNPALSGRLAATPAYRQMRGHLSAAVSGDLEALKLSEFHFLSDTVQITADGVIAIADKSLQLALAVKGRDFRPARELQLAAAEGISVDLDTALEISGPWANPHLEARLNSGGQYQNYRYKLSGAAAGNLEALTFERLRLELAADSGYSGFELRDWAGEQGPVSALPTGPEKLTEADMAARQYRGATAVLVEEAIQSARAGNAWLEVNGVLDIGQAHASGQVSGHNIPLSLAELAGVALPASLVGDISLDGRFSGPFDQPQASVKLFALGEFRNAPWQLQGDLRYASARLDLAGLELLWAERNRLSVHGKLNAEQSDLTIRGQAALADLNFGLPAELAENGLMTLSATAAGSPRQPQLNGELSISGGAATAGAAPLSAQLHWHSEGRNLSLSLLASQGSRSAVDAQARMALAPILEQLFAKRVPGAETVPLPLWLESSGSADLSVVAEFIDPEIHALRGALNFSVIADGDFASPKLNGHITVDNGGYEHRPSSTRLRDIDMAVNLTPAEWRIASASAQAGDKGRLSLAGALTFPSQMPPSFNFELRADEAYLLNSPAVRGAVSGNLALTGTTGDAMLNGSLTLEPFSVQIEQLIGGSVPEIEVVEVDEDGPETEQASPLLRNIALDVAVDLDKQSFIRGLGLDSQLRGQVKIGGTAASPDASGELNIVRGSFDLLGKKFELEEGQVRFENNIAAIYVTGLYEYSDGEITAEISGTTDDLDVTFSSTPEAAQDEIFAQLLFGKSLSDISPLQAVRLVGVVRSLQSGGASFNPMAKTRELLGVDTLDIEQEATDEGDQYALSLGKYITNRIYIELQRSTDPLNPWQAEMQVELRRKLNLEIQSADEGDSGGGSVELQWKKDY
ncbi:translocation/assembly module TamB domain-containing protein [Microbulbifer thermotolerans]|uniref:Translocation/assembly module TamB domain-containing protein n=1 Tax=Microbulbifer thermotolerans TaxID=252514 RepID=A0AB35I222_MICTH|nr:translocation/assembly module TamB domain-containing protein [Microbulbifer thermotolerans]MCX2803137.1 translocation/assembly module TamB domain-containing protein [Microbulbifer thermotolerans]